MGIPDLVFTHVLSDSGAMVQSCPTHHARFCHLELVSAVLHLCSRLTCGFSENCPLSRLVDQKDACMIESELVVDQVDDLSEQLVQLENGRDGAGNFSACFQLASSALQGKICFLKSLRSFCDDLFQFLVQPLKPAAHLVKGYCYLTKLIPTINRYTLL